MEETEQDGQGAASREFSEKVARRKRSILRVIADHDPSLVRLIDAHRFQGDGDEPRRAAAFSRRRRPASRELDLAKIRDQLLRLGYATTIALIILLVWLGFMQD